MFVLEMVTKDGRLSERFATFEEAKRRVEVFAADRLVAIPLIFEELPDGSERLVRADGKPLQWHRLPADVPEPPPGPDEAIPLADPLPGAAVSHLLPDPEEET
jgi:hypothetical protein